MAVRGVSRSTRDVDLLVVDPECLSPATWESLRLEGVAVSIRRGDADAFPLTRGHLIPRYAGDVDDPRGGIRWIIPAKARYWEGRDHVDY